MTATIIVADAIDGLRTLPDQSVQTVVTSPPYFGLRDYGTGDWEGGDEACDHKHYVRPREQTPGGRGGSMPMSEHVFRDVCGKCGARRVDRQIGLEQTPDEYVARLVDVFREVRRVLRDDGTVWLNLGDSYAGSYGNQGRKETRGTQRPINGDMLTPVHDGRYPTGGSGTGAIPEGATYKAKDLMGIPWMVAFALRADGWYLRSDIVWHKTAPMPESVRDRPTRSHEFVFLLAKQPRYYWDADAIREQDGGRSSGNGFVRDHRLTYGGRGQEDEWTPGGGRNKRDVWTLGPEQFAQAHFAVMPTRLVEPCVLAGSSPTACGTCGAPWERVKGGRAMDMSRAQGRRAQEIADEAGLTAEHIAAIRACGVGDVGKAQVTQNGHGKNLAAVQALADEAKVVLGGYYREFLLARPTSDGWEPSCAHDDPSGRSVVLDPFAGSGTVGVVCGWHGRDFIGIELNRAYAQMARDRIALEGRPGGPPEDHRPARVADGQLGLL